MFISQNYSEDRNYSKLINKLHFQKAIRIAENLFYLVGKLKTL